MKLTKQSLFVTPNSFQDIEDFIMRMPKESRAEAFMVAGLTWNLACSASQAVDSIGNPVDRADGGRDISTYMSLTYNSIDWTVFYMYYPGEAPRIGASILPKDSHPGSPADVEITSVYTCDSNGIDNEWDLSEVLSASVIDYMVELILGRYDEADQFIR